MARTKKVTIPKCEEHSYRLTDEYMESMAFSASRGGRHQLEHYRPKKEKEVGSGAWIMVIDVPPVSDEFKPVLGGIYWAIPCRDSLNFDGYGADNQYRIETLVRSKTNERVVEYLGLFPTEYVVVPEEILDEYMEEGAYSIMLNNVSVHEEVDLELIQQGRDLTEDERSIIWALMLDGVSENTACSIYFKGRHTEKDNLNTWYKPCEQQVEDVKLLVEEYGYNMCFTV